MIVIVALVAMVAIVVNNDIFVVLTIGNFILLPLLPPVG